MTELATRTREKEILAWIRAHLPATMLCQTGGWPDSAHARVDICSSNDREWIVNVTVSESIMEISECDVAEYSRCGKFAVTLDKNGTPEGVRLLYPM